MIDIYFRENLGKGTISLEMSGHANAAPFGKDLVCAGTSALLYTLAQNLIFAREDGLLERPPYIKRRDGYAKLVATPKPEQFEAIETMFMTIVNGFLMIQHNYARSVSVHGVDRPKEVKRVYTDEDL